VVRILAIAATLLLAGCQAFWDLPGQMRAPYGGAGSLPPSIPDPDEEESLP
jgi:hypothetical protein